MRPKVRCAIYTRKSTEDGLEQDFNSLDAQFEACSAYITSQKAEGWTLVTNRYDDGGLSGGTLERPALRRLLADVVAGRIDQIVVYKIDRLTRSLSDFAKIVDQLDAMHASFVSVTQSFNTSTSMGRLTLNMLLSFAQFEREVTTERIRDKIAASKRKGLWMGGTVPLGYSKSARTLVINPVEAPLVERIYTDFLRLGSLAKLKMDLDRDGCQTRLTSGPDGAKRGGKPFSKTHLHALLTSPIYAGKIRHKGNIYEGQHPAIIEQVMWDQVQAKLGENAARPRGAGNPAAPSPLVGKLFDNTGDRLTPSHTKKNGKRIRYYVSRRLLTDTRSHHPDAWRLPAAQIEPALSSLLQAHLSADRTTLDLLRSGTATDAIALQDRIKTLVKRIGSDTRMTLWPALIHRCDLRDGGITIFLDSKAIAEALGLKIVDMADSTLSFNAPFNTRKRGVETKIILGASTVEIDHTLVRNIALGRTWYNEIIAGATIQDIAKRTGTDKKRIRQLIEFALLEPNIIEDILTGRHPANLTSEWFKQNDLPIRWDAQRNLIASAR